MHAGRRCANCRLQFVKFFFCLQHLLVQHIFKYRNAEKKVQTAMHGSTYLLSLLWNLKFQNPKIFFGTVYKNLILKKIRRKISVQLPICLCARGGKFLLFDVPAIIFFCKIRIFVVKSISTHGSHQKGTFVLGWEMFKHFLLTNIFRIIVL